MKINQNFQLCSINLTLIFEKKIDKKYHFRLPIPQYPLYEKKAILRYLGVTFLDSVENLHLF